MFTSYEPGAPAQDDFIPLCVPEIRGKEWQYIKDCLDTGWVSSVGNYVKRFESALADYVGLPYAVAASTGTAALHIALLVAGVQRDDEVLVSDLTFIAPANAIRYAGAWPVFMDVELTTWQMDPARVSHFLENECLWNGVELRNRTTGRRVRAVLPVHILGHPVDIDPILAVARKFNLPVIEDATESLGARYKRQPVGSLADIACFSFNGNKVITTGGGGMIVTKNEDWARRAKYLSTQAKDDPLEFVHNEVGYNYRLTNIQAAMGCAQLEQLDEFVASKRRINQTYREAFKNIPGISFPQEADWASSACWMTSIIVDEKAYGRDRHELLQKFSEERIQTRPLWQPLHCSPAHSDSPVQNCSVAEQIQRNALSLPSSVGLTPDAQKKVCQVLIDFCHGG